MDVTTILSSLEKAGYAGWYVLEQDNVVNEEPAAEAGPLADARASVDFLTTTLASVA